jgi:hypothetical protein
MMKRLLESLVVFAFILGVWALYAYVAATLASFLPEEEIVEYISGGAVVLGLLVAIGIAARLVSRMHTRFSDSRTDA